MTKRAAIYGRISKNDPNVPKVENQIADCRELAERNGYVVLDDHVYVDDGISAYGLKDRPGWNQMMVACKSGEFDVLMATSEDRFSRQPMEKELLILACTDGSVQWHTVHQGQTNPASADGAFMATMRAALGRYESANKQRKQLDANRHKRDKGLPGAGCRPFGYKADKITIEPAEAALIQCGTRMALEGARKFAILEEFKNSGLKSTRGNGWHAASVMALIKRWRNAGYVTHGDQPFMPAVWEPILCDCPKPHESAEQREVCREQALRMVEDVRQIFHGAKVPGQWKRPRYLGTGIAQCYCGGQLVASGDDGLMLYRCIQYVYAGKGNASGHVSIRPTILDPLIRDAVLRRYLFNATGTTTVDAEANTLASLHAQLTGVKEQQAKLQDAFLDGIFTKQQTAKRMATLRADEESLTAQIAEASAASVHAKMLARTDERFASVVSIGDLKIVKPGSTRVSPVEAVGRLTEAWDALTLDDQRLLVSTNLEVVVHPGRGPSRVTIRDRKIQVP